MFRIWLTLRTVFGFYLAGLAVATFMFTIMELNLERRDSWLIPVMVSIPIFLISGWHTTPRIRDPLTRDKISKVALSTLFIFYWTCLILMVVQFDRVINISITSLAKLHQFYFFSSVAGGFGTMLGCTFFEQRLEGKKFSF